jgi:hypothetical protein
LFATEDIESINISELNNIIEALGPTLQPGTESIESNFPGMKF